MTRALRVAIAQAESDLENSRDAYLRKTGWELRCDYPGSYWLWQKTLPDGRNVTCNIAQACSMQDNWPR